MSLRHCFGESTQRLGARSAQLATFFESSEDIGTISGRGFLGLPQKELIRHELSVPSADISSRCACVVRDEGGSAYRQTDVLVEACTKTY
jgi:hypothetical protein